MLNGYAIPTILQSITLEIDLPRARIDTLTPPRNRNILAPDIRLLCLTVTLRPVYDFDPLIRVENHGIIHLISYRFEKTGRWPQRYDCMEQEHRQRHYRRACAHSHRPKTVASSSPHAFADEVDARPRSISSLTPRAFVRFHSYCRVTPYALCYSSGLSSRSLNLLTT